MPISKHATAIRRNIIELCQLHTWNGFGTSLRWPSSESRALRSRTKQRRMRCSPSRCADRRWMRRDCCAAVRTEKSAKMMPEYQIALMYQGLDDISGQDPVLTRQTATRGLTTPMKDSSLSLCSRHCDVRLSCSSGSVLLRRIIIVAYVVSAGAMRPPLNIFNMEWRMLACASSTSACLVHLAYLRGCRCFWHSSYRFLSTATHHQLFQVAGHRPCCSCDSCTINRLQG